MDSYSLTVKWWLGGRLASSISLAALLSLGLSGCEQRESSTPRCCPSSTFRGCCSSEPVQSGGLYTGEDSTVCSAAPHTMPACTEFPIRERLDTSRGPHWLPCTELYQATSEQPCECTPQEDGCEPICIVPEAPTLPDACAGVTAPSEGPVICTAAEPPVTYVVSEIEVNTDPAVGFDLDGTEQASCVGGDLVGPDGPGAVDNSLSYVDLDELRPYLDLSVLSRRIFEQVCYGAATLAFEVYPNPEEGCATVSVLSSGEIVASAALHLDGDCLNGAIDRFMLPLPEEEVPLDNVRLTATLDPTGFSNMTLGATAGQYSGRRIFDVLGEQSSYEEYLDIRTDLDTTGMRCDAMSLTLDLGGATEVQ